MYPWTSPLRCHVGSADFLLSICWGDISGPWDSMATVMSQVSTQGSIDIHWHVAGSENAANIKQRLCHHDLMKMSLMPLKVSRCCLYLILYIICGISHSRRRCWLSTASIAESILSPFGFYFGPFSLRCRYEAMVVGHVGRQNLASFRHTPSMLVWPGNFPIGLNSPLGHVLSLQVLWFLMWSLVMLTLV